jgi:hypothetical protein
VEGGDSTVQPCREATARPRRRLAGCWWRGDLIVLSLLFSGDCYLRDCRTYRRGTGIPKFPTSIGWSAVSQCKMQSAHQINVVCWILINGLNRAAVVIRCTVVGVAIEKFLFALLLVV